jgi:hypothetical protein
MALAEIDIFSRYRSPTMGCNLTMASVAPSDFTM